MGVKEKKGRVLNPFPFNPPLSFTPYLTASAEPNGTGDGRTRAARRTRRCQYTPKPAQQPDATPRIRDRDGGRHAASQ